MKRLWAILGLALALLAPAAVIAPHVATDAPQIVSAVVDGVSPSAQSAILTEGGRRAAIMGSITPVASADFTALSALTMPSWLTFSRAGNAMQFDSTGKLTYGPNNLLTYSNTFSNAAWTKTGVQGGAVTTGVADPFGGTAASTVVASSANSRHTLISTGATVSAGGNLLGVVWAKAAGYNFLMIGLNNASFKNSTVNLTTGAVASVNAGLTVTPVNMGNGWWQVSVYANIGADTSGYLWLGTSNASGVDTFVGDGVSGVTIYAATLSNVTYETSVRAVDQVITTSAAYYGPVFDYSYNGSSWVPAGLRIDEQRTNIALQSQTFTNATWTKTNVTAAQNVTGPDGVANSAATITASAGNVTHYAQQPITWTAAIHTVSYYLKAGTNNYAQITTWDGTTSRYVNFDLSGGTVGTASNATGSITSLGGGLYRCALTTSTAQAAAAGNITLTLANSSSMAANATWNAAGTETIIAFGAQAEAGSFATSYIPTTSASVTRAADVVTIGGAAATAVAGSAGSIVLQTVSLNGSSPAAITNLVRGTNSIMYRDTTGKPGTTNGTNILLGGAAPTWSSALRTGLAWSAAGRSLNYTGGTVATDSKTASNGGTLYLGSNNGSEVENGWYQAAAFYNQRLPDATLKRISNVGASFLAANDDFPRYAANDNLPITWRRAM